MFTGALIKGEGTTARNSSPLRCVSRTPRPLSASLKAGSLFRQAISHDDEWCLTAIGILTSAIERTWRVNKTFGNRGTVGQVQIAERQIWLRFFGWSNRRIDWPAIQRESRNYCLHEERPAHDGLPAYTGTPLTGTTVAGATASTGTTHSETCI